MLSPEQPLFGWTDCEHFWAGTETEQRPYDHVQEGSCETGCTATAWTMLYLWYDFVERCEERIAGGPAPLIMNANVLDCLWAVVVDINTGFLVAVRRGCRVDRRVHR